MTNPSTSVEHKCVFVMGSCMCGAMLLKRRLVSKAELLAELEATQLGDKK